MASSDAEVITGVRWMCDAMRRCAARMVSRSGLAISRSGAVGVVLMVSRKSLREVRGVCFRILQDCETLWHSLCHHAGHAYGRSEEHTSELQSLAYLVCRLLLEKKKRERVRAVICSP